MELSKKYLTDLTYEVIGAAIEVHKQIGPGLLESVYHRCLKEEFIHRKIVFHSELRVPIFYRNTVLDADLRCDFLVERCLVVEIKAVQDIHPVFESQVMTYMKLLEVPKGVLLNFFSQNLFRDGQKTFVNELFRQLR